MIDTKLLKSLDGLLREKQMLRQKTDKLAQAERRLIGDLSRALSGTGYRVVRVGDSPTRAGHAVSTDGARPAKALRCPKCTRSFSHPLPMARHLAATHHAKTATKTTRPRRKGKAA